MEEFTDAGDFVCLSNQSLTSVHLTLFQATKTATQTTTAVQPLTVQLTQTHRHTDTHTAENNSSVLSKSKWWRGVVVTELVESTKLLYVEPS